MATTATMTKTKTKTTNSGERATSDHRTVAEMMRDQTAMADIYDKFDRELSQTWRR